MNKLALFLLIVFNFTVAAPLTCSALTLEHAKALYKKAKQGDTQSVSEIKLAAEKNDDYSGPLRQDNNASSLRG